MNGTDKESKSMKQILHTMIAAFTLFIIMHPDKASGIKDPDLSLKSEGAVLMDAKTGRILYEKNGHASMYPASITKIATAIYAIENGDLDEIVTVSEKARNAEGTKVFLEEGEQVPLKRLIQGMLINSGNDAAIAIAEHMSGNVEQFSKDLNEYLLKDVGVEQTNFVNPSGLFDPDHRTTAADMGKITKYAIKNEQFAEIFGTKSMEWEGETWQTTLLTHHKMLKQRPYEGVTGGKNGFVSQSGFTLVTAAQKNGLSLIAVTLKSPNDSGTYNDTEKLLDYGFGHFETKEIAPAASLVNDKKEPLQLTEPIPYTKGKDEKVTTKINRLNELVVHGEDGQELASAKLESAIPEGQGISQNLQENKEEEDKYFSSHFFLAAIAAFLLVTFISGTLYWQTKR